MTADPSAMPDLAAVMDATWPPAATRSLGPFTLRDGAGGGKRVSAASVQGAWTPADLDAAETAMPDPLFVLYPGDDALDAALDARGYRIIDPVVAYAAPVSALTGPLPPLAAFAHWPPLASAAEIWAEGGIGADRIRVMDRVQGAKAVILCRHDDRPAGAAFIGCHGADAMVHAIEVRAAMRRRGCGAVLLRAAANWAAEQGAARLSLLVTRQNLAARALYTRAGMALVGEYHYRTR